MKIKTKFAIGDEVRDKVTNYVGTITAVTVHMHSPVSYLVEDIDETGRPVGDYIVEDRLERYLDDEDDIGCDGDCLNCDLLPEIPDFLKPENLKNPKHENKEIFNNFDMFDNDKKFMNHMPTRIDRLKMLRSIVDQLIQEASNKEK